MTTQGHARLAFAFALICVLSSPAFAQAPPARTVLALFSGSEDHPSNLVLNEAIRRALGAPPEVRIDCFTEYLEAEGLQPESDAAAQLRDFIARKYKGRRFDVVIAMTDSVLRFVLATRGKLFADTPIVFGGLAIPAEIANNPSRALTGVLVGVAYAETLKVALALHPSTERVFVVAKTGANVSQPTLEREFAEVTGRIGLAYINEKTIPGLLAAVRAVPPHSLILYLWHQPEDASNFIYPDTVARLVAETAAVPVYGTSDFYVGLGVVGGVVRLTRETGTRLGQMTRQLLDGARPQDIPIERARVVPIFDWRQLKRWSIDPATLPAGADVRFRTPTLWESYRGYVVGTVAIVAAQLLLIAGLLAQRARRRRAEETILAREASLRTSFERSRHLAGRLINAQEAARAGIARDLHDDVCQQLAFVAIEVRTLKQSSGQIQDAEPQRAFSNLEDRTQGMFDGIRRLSHDLHPASLRLLGLVPALKTHCAETMKRHDVTITFKVDGDLGPLPTDTSVSLFRIAQESIRNGIGHGGARRLSLSVARSADHVELTVTDDGRGFDLEAARQSEGGLGLVSMEERAHVAGGTVHIATAPGQGTSVRVRCPVEVPASGADEGEAPEESPEVVGYPR
jgi:signal transduction histidine kinase